MQIVFIHYHLNAGGVTQVIVNQLRALAQLDAEQRPDRVGVLYGGRHEGWPDKLWQDIESGSLVPFEEVLIPLASLDYSQLPIDRDQALASEITMMLTSHGFAPSDTVLHFHNHSLGKNASCPGAVRLLAERGYRLLLQVHDFAEDFRPANYRHLATAWKTDDPKQIADKQYPVGPSIHYATLTQRDHQLLSAAGIPDSQLHTLPNPVAEFPGLKPKQEVATSVRSQLGMPDSARLVLYPVRGIRRKNLGELLLHAVLSPPDVWHALTLAPENPVEIPSFKRWHALSEELNARCRWNTCGGGTSQFLDVIAAADALITTSVAEGFGMVFLEAWLAGKPLVGRDLPGITGDFKTAGIQFEGLYEALWVPLELLGSHKSLGETLQIAYQWACDNYGIRPASEAEVNQGIEQLLSDGRIDFALLPSRFQEQLIRIAANDPDRVRDAMFEANPALEAQSTLATIDQQPVEANAQVVGNTYSLTTIGKHLDATYASIEADPQSGEIRPTASGETILDHFLRLDRLHAIRFEE